jgi:hypothetical protein
LTIHHGEHGGRNREQDAGDYLEFDYFGGPLYTATMTRNRFRLRSLFIAVAIVAVICVCAARISNFLFPLYYIQVRTVKSALVEHPEIEKVWVSTNDDVTLEIEELYFSIASAPEVIYEIDGIDGASRSKILARLERALQERHPAPLPAYAEQWRWGDWK